MDPNLQIVIFCLVIFGNQATSATESCNVTGVAPDCICVMPKLYDCPEVNLYLTPMDGCSLLTAELTKFSNVSCAPNDTHIPANMVTFNEGETSLQFQNDGCDNEFYFVVDLNGGQLVRTLVLEFMNAVDYMNNTYFEFAYGYNVPCNDQPTINTLLWQYITPGQYYSGADLSEVWNRLNFTNAVYEHVEDTYFKAAYIFIHFTNVPMGSRFQLNMTGCVEQAKDIDPALEYLNNVEIKTEREMQKGGWKINEERHVKRTFVRIEEAE